MALIQRRKRFSLLSARSLLMIGVLSAVMGTYGFRNHWSYPFRAEPVDAVITSIETEDTGTFLIYTPSVEAMISGVSQILPVARTYREVEVGERLTVFSDPEKPQDVRLMDPRDVWLLPAWAILFGFVSVGMAYDKHRREKQDAEDQGQANA
jgi:hypothetical protein